MLTEPTIQQLEALAALAQQGWWSKVDEMIEAEILAAQDRMVDSNDVAQIHELRGWVKSLREFRSTAREASKVLEKKGRHVPL